MLSSDMPTIQKSIAVKAPDGKLIYSTIGLPAKRTKKMIIFVHGFTSTEFWPPILLGSWYARRHGFAYCRINLYDWRPRARTLMTSDLLQHSRDVDTVVRYFKRRGYKHIYAVGHSFGGLTLLQTKTSEFSAISLWDISSFIKYPPGRFPKDRKTGAEYISGAFELLLSKRFKNGMLRFPNELKLISEIEVPTQICYAAGKDGVLIDSSKRYYQHVNAEKSLVSVPNASHSFTEEGVCNLLFSKTIKWFKCH